MRQQSLEAFSPGGRRRCCRRLPVFSPFGPNCGRLSATFRPRWGDESRVFDTDQWRCFVLGYTSACLIVRLDRLLLEAVAVDTVTQRKLNEGYRTRSDSPQAVHRDLRVVHRPGHGTADRAGHAIRPAPTAAFDAMIYDPIVGEFVADSEREKVPSPVGAGISSSSSIIWSIPFGAARLGPPADGFCRPRNRRAISPRSCGTSGRPVGSMTSATRSTTCCNPEMF